MGKYEVNSIGLLEFCLRITTYRTVHVNYAFVKVDLKDALYVFCVCVCISLRVSRKYSWSDIS